ncbi:MAG TPA: hypothetical protein VKU19_36650 [Bryobacteraceae bacterium]|nr:hypothetical protein [Bryobacteraceae bacterium]
MGNRFSFRGTGRRPEAAIPGAFSWILVLLLVMTLLPFVRQPEPVRSPVVRPPAKVVTVEAQIQAVGADSQNRILPFTVYVLSQQLSWKLDSVTDLANGRTLMDADLAAAINRARDIFCVGTASSEGARRPEEARAAQRATQLAEWVGTVVQSRDRTRVFTLNAGQYRGPPELESVYQRKAILIVTSPHDEEVNLGEGLASGLERQQQEFPVVRNLIHDYSRSKQWLREIRGPKARRPAGRRTLVAKSGG